MWNSFFLCVALFDAFCSLRGNRSGIEATPSVCDAVVGVVKKADCATVLVKYEDLAEQASRFSQWLNGSGHVEMRPEAAQRR